MPIEPTRLFLLRHGEVSGQDQWRYYGQVDVPLSEEGWRQVRCQAERLKGEPVRAVYASDLARSRGGAEVIAETLGVPLHVEPALREVHMGHWQGLPREAVRATYPGEYDARYCDIMRYRIPGGGENILDLEARVMPVVEGLLARHATTAIALVGHGFVNRVILCHALAMRIDDFLRIDQDYGCLNIIDYLDDRAAVSLVNGIVY